MKTKLRSGFRMIATLLVLVSATSGSIAKGEAWNSWMGGPKAEKVFESQVSMARLSERHGQSENAIKIYTAVLEKNPQHQLAHHRLGVMYATEGDFAKANQHFHSAMQAGPASAELMSDQGYCLFLQERYEEAEQSLRQTIQRFPTHKAAHNSLGLVLGHMGRYEEALAEFRLVVGEAEAHANLAFIMSHSGQLEQASKHYHLALELDKNLRPAAEALIEINKYLPAQSSVFTRNPADSSKRNQWTASSASQNAQPVLANNSVAGNQLANVDAARMKSDDPNNPIPPVAQPAIPQTPQIPAQVQTPFQFGTSAFKAPEATQPLDKPSASVPEVSLAQKLIASVEDPSDSQPSVVSSAQHSEVQPTNPIATEQAAPASRVQVRDFDNPHPQVIASDEQDETQALEEAENKRIAAAKAYADSLMQKSQLEQPQSYPTQTSANLIATSISQTGSEYFPTAFVVRAEEATAPKAVKLPAGELKMAVPEAEVNSAPATGKVVLVTVAVMFGLISAGGAFWYLGKRKFASTFAHYRMSAVEVRPFNVEETYANLESRIREVLSDSSSRSRSQFGSDSTQDATNATS